MYTISTGLDIERILPQLWKAIIIHQKAFGETLETHLFETNDDTVTVTFTSEDPTKLDLVRNLLGIYKMSDTVEITLDEYHQFSPGLSPEELLLLARTVTGDQVLPEDQQLWVH